MAVDHVLHRFESDSTDWAEAHWMSARWERAGDAVEFPSQKHNEGINDVVVWHPLSTTSFRIWFKSRTFNLIMKRKHNMELNNELLETFYWQATKSNRSIYNVNNILFVIKHPILSMQLIWFAVKVIGIARIDDGRLHKALNLEDLSWKNALNVKLKFRSEDLLCVRVV